ncbi:hypothetical protein BDA99DRAFT_567854 [Phascolomyces articulosus]|uniref:DUF155 domain-containing protein n=1 Tax=Phascolomyces articulosus TaxID=60185 RepID=A0AAD5PJP3_9FUNG|nr:hypothetical protein BDA99DRAFT_567854 [Phascolomyces articulosus]
MQQFNTATRFLGQCLKSRFSSHYCHRHYRPILHNPFISSKQQFYSTQRSIRHVGQVQDSGALQNLMRRVMEIDAEINNIIPKEDFQPNNLTCKAYCTAESYDFSALKETITAKQKNNNESADESHDMIHVEIPQGGEAYVFANGTCVTWAAQDNEAFIHETLGPVCVKPIGQVTTEAASFAYDQDEPTGLKGGLILLNPDCSPQLAKAAFSYGLARSVKLASLEDTFDRYMERAQTLRATRKELQDASTDLIQFHQQMMANARDGFLDTPELHWSRSELEGYYTSISQNLDVRPRISILNKKLEHADAQLADLRQNLAEKSAYNLQWLMGLVLVSIIGCKMLDHSNEQLRIAAAEDQMEDVYSVHTPTVVT